MMKELQGAGIPMHSLLVMRDGRIICEHYYTPCDSSRLQRLFSVAKTVTALAIGALADRGRLTLDDPVCEYFPEYISSDTHPWIRTMTIRNLLMMRTCHSSTTYKKDLSADWVKSFFVTRPTHKPGTLFQYDTSGAHTLAALAEKLAGKPVLTFLKEEVLYHLDLSEDSYMLTDPFGISQGGSGLMARPMDLLKLTYLLECGGRVVCSDGVSRQLISESFVKTAISNLSDTLATAQIPALAQGYGYMTWQNEWDGFTLYGMGGQFGICIPGEKLLVVTTADTQGMAGADQRIFEATDRYLLDGKKAKSIASAQVSGIEPPSFSSLFPGRIKTEPAPCDLDLSFDLADSPYFDGLSVRVDAAARRGSLTFKRQGGLHTIEFGLGHLAEGSFPMGYDTPYAAGGVFLRRAGTDACSETADVLYIHVHLLGTEMASVRFELCIDRLSRDLTMRMRKTEETKFCEFQGFVYGQALH